MDEFARRLRAARAYAGITAAELAERIEISQASIHRVETGQRIPPLNQKQALAFGASAACGLPFGFFFGDFNQMAESEKTP